MSTQHSNQHIKRFWKLKVKETSVEKKSVEGKENPIRIFNIMSAQPLVYFEEE